MKLSKIMGQDRAVGALRTSLAGGRMHHSMLFAGPRGVGKRTAAVAVAASMNCPGRAENGDACGECPSCLKSLAGTHPDVHVLMTRERADETRQAGHLIFGMETERSKDEEERKSRREIFINAVRDLEYYLDRAPMEGGFKVALIIDADRMNANAAGALLKTLEEPDGSTVLMLTTAAQFRLPPTVVSRCRMVRFAALPEALVASVLEERHGLPREKAAVLAHVSGGSLGRALQLDGQEMLEWMMEALSGAAVVPWSTASDALSLAGELGRSRERADTAGRILGLLDLLGVYCRDAAAGAWRGGWERIVGAEALDRMDARSAAACFGTLEEARTALELHCSPQITLEALFMRMREAVRRG